MKFIRWFAGFFEDQKGSGSSKRVIMYLVFLELHLIVNGSLNGKVINTDILYAIVLTLLFLVGAVTSEFIGGTISDFVSKKKSTE